MVEPAPPSGEVVEGEHRLGVRVYYEDTDFTGVVYHANYLRYFERGRSEFLRLVDDGQTPADSLFAVVRMEIDFRAPAKIHDALVVRTRLAEVRGARLIFAQSVQRADTLLCQASVTAAPITADGRVRRPGRKEVERWTMLRNSTHD